MTGVADLADVAAVEEGTTEEDAGVVLGDLGDVVIAVVGTETRRLERRE